VNRHDFEHVVRAAGAISDDDELVVIGSQSIHGQFVNPPASLLVSAELDVYPKNHPDRADDIDGAIGELSLFHESYGYYAQGVGPETAVLPAGWQSRLVRYNSPATRGVTAHCLEVHDLAIAKLVAGRPKDLHFCAELARHRMIDERTLLERLAATTLDEGRRETVRGRVAGSFSTP
jgi:hypothetical protein